jgi:hypothetical protein
MTSSSVLETTALQGKLITKITEGQELGKFLDTTPFTSTGNSWTDLGEDTPEKDACRCPWPTDRTPKSLRPCSVNPVTHGLDGIGKN